MGWFNYYGLAIMAIIMIPNIIYATKHKDKEGNNYHNKAVSILEQIGRYGCLVFMLFNIPYTYFNFWFNYALIVYLVVNASLCLAYLIFWIICWNQYGLLKALTLSIIPSCIFLFSGIVLANIPLIIFAILFAVNHIFISCKKVVKTKRKRISANEKMKNVVIIIFITFLVVLAIIGTIFDSGNGRGAFPLD